MSSNSKAGDNMKASCSEEIELVEATSPPPTQQSPPSRSGDAIVQITPESRTTSWWQRNLNVLDETSDDFELYIQKFDSGRMKNLSQDYGQLKYKPVDDDFAKAFLSLNISRASEDTPTRQTLEILNEAMAFGASLECIRSKTTITDSVFLRRCVLCCRSPPPTISKLYPLSSKLFVSSQRMRQKNCAPWLCMLLVIAEQWKLPERLLTKSMKIGDPLPQKLIPFNKKFAGTRARPLLLDSDEWTATEFHWHGGVPRYKENYMTVSWLGDYKIYVWQPQVDIDRFPPQRATILLSGHSTEIRDMIILLRPSLKKLETGPISYFEEQEINIPSQVTAKDMKNGQIMISIIALYNIILLDSEICAEDLLDEISILRLEGRRQANSGKINFVLHLDDIRQSAMLGIREAIAALPTYLRHDEGLPCNTENPTDETFKELIQILRDRAVALEEKFTYLGQELNDLRAMLREQIDLNQIGITRILTILAAIYLPFNLVASIFGMNLRNPLWNNPPGDSSFPSSPAGLPAASNDTSFSQSQTDEIVSAISNGNNYSWPFKSFWYTAVIAAALTILLPLVAPWIFRSVIRFSYQHVNYWIISLFLIALALIVISDEHLEKWVFLIIFGGLQALAAIWNLSIALLSGKKKKRWIAFSTFLSIIVAIDLFYDHGIFSGSKKVIHRGVPLGITGYFPPFFLFVIWIQPVYPNLGKQILMRIDRSTPNPIKQWDLHPTYIKYSRFFGVCFLVLLGAINAALSYALPGLIYLLATAVPFGLYGIDGLLSALGHVSETLIWCGYLFVLGVSIFLWLHTLLFLSGPVVLFPSIYLLVWKGIAKWKKKRRQH